MRSVVYQLVLAVILFVATVCLFKTGFAHRPDGNRMEIYMALSHSHLYPPAGDIPPMYESRQLPCVLTSRWFDYWQPDPYSWNLGGVCYGAYNGLWVLLLLVTLIFVLRNAYLPMLGVLAGLAGNSVLNWPPYYMPWDMPAMFFFTAAYLCYRKKWWVPLLAIVFIGSFFKETILLGALFALNAPWKWRGRVGAIVGVIVLATLLDRLWMPVHSAPAWYYSIQLWRSRFSLKSLLDLWPVLMANTGGVIFLVIYLVRLRDWPLRLVVAIFIAGQCLNDIGYGVYNELRVWCELLPLGWILFNDLLFAPRTAKSANSPGDNSGPPLEISVNRA
ncbi:MAG TPA: hypothetical protein VFV81_09400 [Verrucomicrobiae bacterium]|nr:hypothetical protein [Verrucomicrobiae bacterium]